MRYWHNARCSKSREGLALLKAHGVEVEVVDYLANPPSAQEIEAVMRRLGGDPRQLVRFKEDLAGELGLSAKDERTARDWAEVLAANPRLIERPLLDDGRRAVIGRPTEALLELLG
ncbi:arsenate reductase family protein [Arenimonas composti]|uniref:Arsenate reductase n=1 Tax=Arenimonas composti TR7-09 = DSM 18010 TaxID=1121013 RepID=A0A091BZP2_9GAMM|nr:arsenate reductase family protein [Arenimonas composti]KFN49830.1 hypothetical protein P873_08900 [Arenimonas composti TR7-09 = DSM 18010]